MPIFLVKEDVLDLKLECIINPIKHNELFIYKGVEKLIFEKAGKAEMIRLYDEYNVFDYNTPFITSGLKLSDKVIHIVAPEMCDYDVDFKEDILNSYGKLFRIAMDENIKKLVFPPMPYGYKRQGGMNTYKTGRSIIRYLYDYYNPDFTVYIMVSGKGFYDHMENYKTDYVPTSWPLSKRHKPLVYPFITINEVINYINKENIDLKEIYRKDRNLNLHIEENPYLHSFIDDASFYIKANLSKERYLSFFNNNEIPTKYELLSIAITLNFSIEKTIDTLKKYNLFLDENDKFDNIIMCEIIDGKHDVFEVNEILFYNNLPQLGSYIPPQK